MIKSVTYHLHPTYDISVVKVRKAPFILSRCAWGYFVVKIEIEFNQATNLPLKVLEYELCFDFARSEKYFTIDLPDSKITKKSKSVVNKQRIWKS